MQHLQNHHEDPVALSDQYAAGRMLHLRAGALPAPDLPSASRLEFGRIAFHIESRSVSEGLDGFIRQGVLALPSMGAGCRQSVCMAVAAHEEELVIGNALAAFRHQHLRPDAYELVLFLNHPATRRGAVITPDRSISIVEKFKADHPDLPVHSFYLTLPEASASIGLVRRIANDVVLARYLQRGPGYPDHLLLQQDADMSSAHPRLLIQALTRFARAPGTVAVQGPIDFDWRASLEDPILLIGHRLMRAIDAYRASHGAEFVCSHGQNIAVRASDYARCGGHNPGHREGENISLSLTLRALQRADLAVLGRNHPGIVAGGPAMRVWTSPRRGAHALRQQETPFIEQWQNQDSAFSLNDSAVRTAVGTISPERFLEKLEQPDFPLRLTRTVNRTLGYLRRAQYGQLEDLAEAVLHRRFGLQYTWIDNGESIKIEDSSAARAFCRNFALHADRHFKSRLELE